jgi:O-antigen/teichoic acid export membrane protein
VFLASATLRELSTVVPQLRQETAFLARLNLGVEYGGAALAVALVLSGRGPSAVFLATGLAVLGGVAFGLSASLAVCGRHGGFDRGALRELLRAGLPSLVIASGQWVLLSLDSLFLSAFHGAGAVGVYGLAYAVGSVLLLVSGVLNLFFFPTLVRLVARAAADTSAFVASIMRLTIALLGILVAGAVLLGPWALAWLTGPAYAEAGRVLPAIVVSFALLVFTHLLQALPLALQRKSGPLARCYVAAALLNLVLDAALIPRFGLGGAAAATLASYAFAAALVARLAHTAIGGFAWARVLSRPLAAALLAFGASLAFSLPVSASLGSAVLRTALLLLGYGALAWGGGALRQEDWRRVSREG